jgi:hypothetical protein
MFVKMLPLSHFEVLTPRSLLIVFGVRWADDMLRYQNVPNEAKRLLKTKDIVFAPASKPIGL